MLIGERPGENEAKERKPFVGLAGRYLDRYMFNAGIDRNFVYITNLVKTFVEYGKPQDWEIRRDWPELMMEILEVQPQIVGLLGTYATEFMLGVDRANLDRTHGIPVYAAIGGFYDCIAVPMTHPAAGLYSTEMMPQIMSDFVYLRMVMDGKLRPTPDLWAGNEDYGKLWTETRPETGIWTGANVGAIDTEGSAAAPWCATASFQHGTARIYLPTVAEKVPSVLGLGCIYLHNSLHDLAVLRSMGISLGDDQFLDTMVLSYLLAIEPQGLKELAWRWNGMEMQSYGEIIAEADRNVALAYLEGINANEWSPAKEYVVVEGGKARIRKPNSINQRVRRILADVHDDKRDSKGDRVDPRARWNKIEYHLKQEVVEALGPMPEATLNDVPRSKAVHYACRDADATLRLGPQLQAKINAMGLSDICRIDHGAIPIIDRMQHTGIGLAEDKFWVKLEDECDAQMGRMVHSIRQGTGWEINPDSPVQVAELLYDHLKLPVVKLTEGGNDRTGGRIDEATWRDASTKDKALEAIVHLHPVVDMVLDYREASKIKSSYVSVFRSILRSGANRVHPNLRITRVVTGRLACNEPNLLAIPVRSKLGKKVRGGFIAGEGRVIADYDLDQVEMRWMADESRDEALCRIFIDGKVDVHTDTAANMFGKSYNSVVTEERYAAKRVGFGVITGITEYGLLDQMILARAKRPDGEQWTLDDCKQMIAAFFGTRPGVRRYMDDAGNEAEKFGYVRDRWGRIRYLPGAWSPIPAIKAEARRQASSFKIQAGAQGLIKRAMAVIWSDIIRVIAGCYNWNDMWSIEPLLQIHDSLMFDMTEDAAHYAGQPIINAMCHTTKSNTGLPFKAKGGTGKTWGSVKD
jgi:uracil-DNA glycosylase family 4